MVELLSLYKAIDNNKRYTVISGGRGSAKSFHLSVFLLILTYAFNEVILFTRYTMRSAHISIIPEFKTKIELLECEKHFYITKDEIVNKLTKSRILFRGINTSSGNQTSNLKSIEGLTCWASDEATELPLEEEFDTIDESIRTKGKHNRVILSLNPDDIEHWIYKRFFQSGELEDCQYIHTTYLDNLKNLDQGFINLAEKTKLTNPKRYERKFLGKWVGVEDIVFTDGFEIYEDEITNYEWDYNGGDFGFTDDPTTIIGMKKVGSNLYLKEKLWEYGLTNPQISQHIKDIGDEDLLTIFDSAEPKSIAELQMLNCYVVGAIKGADSVDFGIQKIKQFNIFIHKDSKKLQYEWNNWKWARNKKTGEILKNKKGRRIPENKNKHGIDASRYVITYFYFD